MPDTSAPRVLLLLGCSRRKHHTPGVLPALDRYDGVNYRVLQRAKRSGYWPASLDVLIISAEFGLLASGTPIPYYDRLMTPARAAELRSSVSAELDDNLTHNVYGEVFVNLGKTYLLAVANSSQLRTHPRVVYAQGGIGEKMAQMKHWLYARSDTPIPASFTGKTRA